MFNFLINLFKGQKTNFDDVNVRKSIVEKYIEKNAKSIHYLDGKALPMVMLELQAEEAAIQHVKNHKSITSFSKQTLKKVFSCWFSSSTGNDWFDNMAKEELSMLGK